MKNVSFTIYDVQDHNKVQNNMKNWTNDKFDKFAYIKLFVLSNIAYNPWIDDQILATWILFNISSERAKNYFSKEKCSMYRT